MIEPLRGQIRYKTPSFSLVAIAGRILLGGSTMKNKTISSIPRNESETLQVSMFLADEKLFADVRIFYATIDGMRPTKKGISIPVERLPLLIQSLTEISSLTAKFLEPDADGFTHEIIPEELP